MNIRLLQKFIFRSISILVFTFSMVLFSSCKNDKPTEPEKQTPSKLAPVPFTQGDLAGYWRGTALNSYDTIDLDLKVDFAGRVTGSGVNSTWIIKSDGAVTGKGSFGFAFSRGAYFSTGASWSLQLDSSRMNLLGRLNISYHTLQDMHVTLER